MRPARIALLAHSTNPRGGVVHALALGDALTRLGHDVVVHAPDAKGAGFFRRTLCEVAPFPVAPCRGGVAEMAEARIADYVRFFERREDRRFDIYHAQDGISGNALASLKARGRISNLARTVHHIDDFADQRLAAMQSRSIAEADLLFTVSQTWREILDRKFNRGSTVVGAGVDCTRYSPFADGHEAELRKRLGIRHGLVFLAIGGVEERKNTIRILEAFAQIRAIRRDAQLVIAGGASLLDHSDYQRRFAMRREELGLRGEEIVTTGAVSNDEMPALYRLADALVFPSVKEGFGLVVLEAMASGLPVVVGKIAPFVEYLADGDVAWCDPVNVTTIADAMLVAAASPVRARLITRGRLVATRHDWLTVAKAHVAAYAKAREPVHA
jgi:glycosyltransferase-like protein